MKAVVMAGGEGSRLRPVTANLPKPLVPVCNKPIMEHILTLLKRHGITEVVATVHYLEPMFHVYAESGAMKNSTKRVREFVKRIEGMQA